jgi:hypothetical protein
VPALGRHVHFDERSRGFPVRSVLPLRVPHTKRIWGLPNYYPLDQGSEGACVGFGFAGELAADPVVIHADNSFARDLYRRAQAEDRLMGNDWSEGASVLAGARACKRAGHISSYRWAFGVNDVIDTLCHVGPVVVGVPWYESMYDTSVDGLVDVSGDVVGGHCILLTGYWPAHPGFGDVVLWENSWGPGYGVNGRGFIRVADLARLLAEDGEAVVAVDTLPRPPEPRRPWWRRFFAMFGFAWCLMALVALTACSVPVKGVGVGTVPSSAPPAGVTATVAPAAVAPTSRAAVPAPAPKQSASYANCSAARAAGAAPIYRGEPGYAAKLDRDSDGIACE